MWNLDCARFPTIRKEESYSPLQGTVEFSVRRKGNGESLEQQGSEPKRGRIARLVVV